MENERPLSDLVQQLPYPLALKLSLLLTDHERRVAGEDTPRFGYDLCATAGLLIRMTAAIAIQSYVHIAGASDAAMNRSIIQSLQTPSDGAWRDLAVLVLNQLAARDDAPLARRCHAAFAARIHVPNVANVGTAFQDLVRYRNRLVHGEAVTDDDTTRAFHLLVAAADAFRFLADYELLVRRENRTYRLSGVLPVPADEPPDELPEDEPCLVRRDRAEPALSLSPLLVFREGRPHGTLDFDELFFLNAGAAERLNYIAYRYARGVDGRELGAYNAFRRFLSSVPAPHLPPDPRIDFTSLIEEHEQLFVGREAVLAAIEAFVAQRPAAYGLVTARGGLGKTALFTRLHARHAARASEVEPAGHRWVFHFCMAQSDRDNPVVALRSLIAQVCDAFGMPRGPYLSQDLEALRTNLDALLKETVTRVAEGERLVIAVDALDEGITDSPRDALPAALPARVPEHVVVLVSYRVDEHSRNTRVERMLGHVPATERRGVPGADPLGGLSRVEVRAFLERIADRVVTEAVLDAVWRSAAGDAEDADPFFLRFVAEGVDSGRIDLARPETVPATLDEAFDELWMRLPADHDFLVHRILGMLAIMRDYADDEMFAALLGGAEGAEPLSALDVAALRAEAGKLLVYDGDRYGLVHDRFRQFLVGEQSADDRGPRRTAAAR
jgi:hypothetical protein